MVNWPVALGLGMWSCVLLDNQWTHLWALLAGLLICLPLRLWKKAGPWVLFGWTSSAGLLFADEHSSRGPTSGSPIWTEVLVSPQFVESTHTNDDGQLRGIWEAMDPQGRRFRIWMATSASDDGGFPRWAWVNLHPLPRSDVSDAFSFEAYLISARVRCQAHFLKWSESAGLSSGSRSVEAHIRAAALRWRTWLKSRFSGRGQGLILGMFAGDRKAVPTDVRESFEHLGLAHLLAVSGYHVGLVAGPFLLLLRFQNRWLRRLSVLGVLIASAFVLSCGAPVSGIRSWLMVVLTWALMVRGRAADAWTAWGVAACLAVLRDVHVPLGVGAQLSFLATGSLLALTQVRSMWRVPLRAQMSTAFITVPSFQVLPWAFYPANLLAGPLMLGFGLLVAGGILGPPCLGEAALKFSQWLGNLAVGVDDRWTLWSEARRWSGASGQLLLFPLGMFWVLRLLPGRRRRSLLRFALCTTCILGVLQLTWEQSSSMGRTAKINFWMLKGKTPCAAVTDGYGGLGWCPAGNHQQVHHAATAFGLEGPVEVHPWNGLDIAPKKWIHPPFQVWIHQEVSKMSSEPVSLE